MKIIGGDRTVRLTLGVFLAAPGFVDLSIWLNRTSNRTALFHEWLFDVAIATTVLALLVMTTALPFFSRPVLKLIVNGSMEFHPPLGAGAPTMKMATEMTGLKAVSGFTMRIRIDETRGITADDVVVKLANVDPPQEVIPIGQPLDWQSGEKYGRVIGHGFDYVRLFDRIELESGKSVVTGALIGISKLAEGSKMSITLEAWWRGRKMDSLDMNIEAGVAQLEGPNSPPN